MINMLFLKCLDKKLRVLLLLLFLLLPRLEAQVDPSIRYASTIDQAALEAHIRVLTSDSLGGRETGTLGQRKAAQYLAAQFKEIGLKPGAFIDQQPSYFQHFPIRQSLWDEVYMEVGAQEYTHLENMLYLSNSPRLEEKSYEVLLPDSSLTATQLKDKLLAFEATSIRAWRQKVNTARQSGALGAVIFVENRNFQKDLRSYKPYLAARYFLIEEKSEEDPEFALILPSSAFKHFFGVRLSKKSTAVRRSTQINCRAEAYDQIIRTENVIGYLEGSQKKNELLVLSAHYDHLGTQGKEIYRGADDNGSGIAALLELARAFAVAKSEGHPPLRSIAFIAMTGEEKGLLGSEYYTRHPSFPLEQTITNLNIDMIGRIDTAHLEDPNYVYLIGSDRLSSELHAISERANQTYTQLNLDYTFNHPNDPNRFYYRSDHYNFAKRQIPVIFYFSGVHEDYHQPSDTMEKILYEKYIRIIRLIFHTSWDLVTREQIPKVDQAQEQTDQ